ncbi:hypothetical protein QAD02_020834 [Eretmocerus hayati]|uniref:Uncharacterized protein n=1 Tax=Eretmocerus hayati TaxID=131215 RepID=A0ACC2PNG5_9HYME|nr:hypothetical protein QAD02_020834 [Eretmocerus hayati]
MYPHSDIRILICNNRLDSRILESCPQGQLAVSSIVGNQPAPKRELTFPADSVEAVTPVPLKRRRLTRTNIAPIEAWRIMMSLRSGLLAESCWALDVLNILLFDDSSVHYFGLSHLPGLLDTLLEHFTRSLSDMLDFTLNDGVRCTSQMGWMNSRVDLGAVTEPINPGDHITLLSSPNFTLTSRRGKPVRLPTRDEDLFVLDHQRSWDSKTDEIEIESWQVGRNTIEYIVTYLESEIGINSRPRVQVRSECSAPQMISGSSALIDESSENGSLDVDILGTPQSQNEKNSDMDRRSSHERKRKNRSMNDVLSKIERPPVEMDDLSREISEKKSDNLKNLNKKGDEHTFSRTPEIVTPQGHNLSNEERTQSENSDRNYSLHKVTDQESGRENDKNLTSGPFLHEPCSMNIILSSGDGITLKLKIRDPAGTLTRRRMSDHENESYSKDDASLYLVTETQDSIAKRCVCLSTILRNLTFIPGNEAEFARNVTFLGLTGKLLLLHHEHPARAQKTRNYDREEDADSSDSCSSLQSETEWWWDFLHHVRENVLVISANIAGYIDLSLYSEEISRPILDGLLHWAVCPAAHGQDPFPTVSLNSALSPQRLALEALCKLCVTENNVDLVIATPPYCRLQKLCSVLARLLCRSEEQVLREFGINLLFFLSAADSGIARTIALQTSCIALLIIFIEQAENSALTIANQHGIAALRDNPDSMGTSLDMLRRAAGTLLNLARHPNNRTLLLQYETRILALVMSQILDQQVAAVLAKVLFKCSRVTA